MKFDKSGAAAVFATMMSIGQLKPPVNVVGIMPMVENMPSGKAIHPGDIVVCMNGKSVEITNTDAEGRLILADSLCYAEKYYHPHVIIDIATLTGAALYSLGHFYSIIMTKNSRLSKTLRCLGSLYGDRLWELPLEDDFLPALKSDVADFNNNKDEKYMGTSITAGLFLQNFVEKTPNAHIDIAGTAYNVPEDKEFPDFNYVGNGATGVGSGYLLNLL